MTGLGKTLASRTRAVAATTLSVVLAACGLAAHPGGGGGPSGLHAPSGAPVGSAPATAPTTPDVTPAPAASGGTTPGPGATPPVRDPGPDDGFFSGDVHLGDGRHLRVACAGSGAPTVILDHGLGGSSAHWRAVLDRIGAFTHVCAIDRIGAGGSSPAGRTRTVADNVEDLHRFLEVARIQPPAVLVGHSIAGLNLRLHAGRHPGDVGALLFVDVVSPRQPQTLLQALGPPAQGETRDVALVREYLARGWPGPDALGERLDVAASEPEVLAVRSLGDRPTIVLSASVSPLAISEPAAGILRAAWYRLHEEIAALSSDGRRETVDGAGHFIQHDRPEVVVEAVRELVERVRRRG